MLLLCSFVSELWASPPKQESCKNKSCVRRRVPTFATAGALASFIFPCANNAHHVTQAKLYADAAVIFNPRLTLSGFMACTSSADFLRLWDSLFFRFGFGTGQSSPSLEFLLLEWSPFETLLPLSATLKALDLAARVFYKGDRSEEVYSNKRSQPLLP